MQKSKKLLLQAVIVSVLALLMSAVFASTASAATHNASSSTKQSTTTHHHASLAPSHQIGYGQSNAGPSALSGCTNPYYTGNSDTFFAYTGTDSSIYLYDVNRHINYKTSRPRSMARRSPAGRAISQSPGWIMTTRT